jgi:hypothetical protein
MRKAISIFLCFCIFSIHLFAQKQKVKNQPYGDQKLYHFGISVGMNFQDILLTNSGLLSDEGETWFATIPNYSPGFSVGLLGDLYLNPYMNLRFTPTLHFGDKQFEFVEPATGQSYMSILRSNYMTTPLDLKIRSMRLNNYRPYLIAGVYSAVDLGRKPDEAVFLKPIDYGVFLGIGCDLYLTNIKIAPELRFSFGLKDVVEHDRRDITDKSLIKYANAVSKGVNRMISLTFNFE